MRRFLLIAAVALGSLPAGAHAQTGQTAWTFTIPVQISNALTPSVNVGCIVFTPPAIVGAEEARFGMGNVMVPLDANGNASSTVTVNVPNTSGNPYDATDYRCYLTLTQRDGTECRPQMGTTGKTDICYAKEGTEFVPLVNGKVK